MKKEIAREYTKKDRFGFKYISDLSVCDDVFHVSHATNDKLGKCLTVNFPIVYTCVPTAECRVTGNCYCKGSTYEFVGSLINQHENLAFYRKHGADGVCREIDKAILEHPNCENFRYDGCGEIPDRAFFEDVVIKEALEHPNIDFWVYTKKYSMVNNCVRKHGLDSIPSNLTILFSEWTDEENRVFIPVENPYNFPIARFIPITMVDEYKNTVDKLCECNSPWTLGHCDTCNNGCKTLTYGQIVGFIEHSTGRTKAKDKLLKARRDYCQQNGITTKEAYISVFGEDDIFAI